MTEPFVPSLVERLREYGDYMDGLLREAVARIAALEAEVAKCLGHKTKIALTLKVAELEEWVKHVQNAHADECASCDDRARRYFTALQSQAKESE